MKCSRNSSKYCGGSSRLSAYNCTSFVAPSMLQNIGMYRLKGCFTDSTSARGLSLYSFTNGTGMSEELCVATCQAKGYGMAGIEYAKECYCGKALARTSVAAPGGIAD
jgi:hypothetical protein